MAILGKIGSSVGAWLKSRIDALREAKLAAERARIEAERLAPPIISTSGVAESLQYEWFPIEDGRIKFWVFRDAAKINGIRINVTAAEAQTIADDLGALLTTPKIEDLIYKHATVKIPPFPGDPAKKTAAQHSAEIDKALAGGKGLVATVGKSWVLSNKLTTSKAMNYGWHTTIKPAQLGPWPSISLPGINVFQQPGTAHNPQHEDYSQTLRLVARKVLIDGQVWDLEVALRNPDVASLFSHEGVLSVTRQPFTGGVINVGFPVPAPEQKEPYAYLHPVPGMNRFSNADLYKMIKVAESVGADPQFLAAVISIESGFRTDIKNPNASATGLIQFIEGTAKMLGTSTSELKRMNACRQLDYVEKFYKRTIPGGIKDPADLYIATFMPAYVGHPDSEIMKYQGKEAVKGTHVYDVNAGLDYDKDGKLSVGDVRNMVRSRVNASKQKTPIPVYAEECNPQTKPSAGGIVAGVVLVGAAIALASKVS